jgi:hypothetical protein
MASDFAGSVVHGVVDEMRCDAADPEEVEGCPDNGGREVEIDAKNFRVMQGREKEKPKRKKVDSLKRAIQAKRPIDRVIVYEDAATSDKYAPNGGHRQQAFDELGLPVPATLFTVPSARERAEEESCYANEALYTNKISRINYNHLNCKEVKVNITAVNPHRNTRRRPPCSPATTVNLPPSFVKHCV